MIITCKKQIPFRWIPFIALPWASYAFNNVVMSVAFIFSLKKFVENPIGLTFIISLPTFLSILLVPICNFLSDRVWTRFGRRKPFVATGWVGMATCMVLMPLMPSFWWLLAVFIAYNLCNDIGGQGGPMEPLYQEIVPPHQRGRATGARQWYSNMGGMVFYFFALGRFDDVRYMAGMPLIGETAIYWIAGAAIIVVLLFVTLGIKEIDQKSTLVGQRLSIRNFFGAILDRELWPVFTLIFGAAMLDSGLGVLGNLLYIDQWNYTKQEMGINVVTGGIINMFLIGFLALIADRLNRMRAYKVLICLALGVKASYFIYVEYVLPDGRPSLIEIIVFGESLSIIGILTGMVLSPLIYDYVTRNKMGTYGAGAGMLSRVTHFLTLNGVGVFVWGYAALFQPPAGEMVRVVLSNAESRKQEVLSLIQNANWLLPRDGAPIQGFGLHVGSWRASGARQDIGRCWEIRLPDTDSEQLVAKKTRFKSELSPLLTEEQLLREAAVVLTNRKKQDAAAHKTLKADATKVSACEIEGKIRDIDIQLASRAGNFQKQVATVLGKQILADGEQVTGAGVRPGLIIELQATKRPDGHRLERILGDLRREHPEVISLRPMKRNTGYGIAVSALLPHGVEIQRAASSLQTALERAASVRDPHLLIAGTPALSRTHQSVLAMDLMILEEPLDTRVSPITRVVNAILALFDRAPVPEHRLSAMARKLQVPNETDHVRVDPGANNSKFISVLAVVRPTASKAAADLTNDPVGKRISLLLGPGQERGLAAQSRALYDRIESAAASQRLTVARPFVNAAYAPKVYDYMCGYIWMFLMGLVGLTIVFAFSRREAKGFIRKRGVEEAQAS